MKKNGKIKGKKKNYKIKFKMITIFKIQSVNLLSLLFIVCAF